MGFSSLVADLVTVTPPQFLAYTREGFTEPSDARLRSPSSSSDWINASRRVTSPSCWLPHGTVPRLTVSSPEPHPDGLPVEVPGSAWQLTARRHRRATALFQGSDLVSVVCDSVAPFWTSDAFSGSLRWPKRSLTAGHLRLATKDHPHMKPGPS
jgi:hypothetical protein